MASDDVRLTDLEVIQRYSIAVRGETADRAELLEALKADVAFLDKPAARKPAAKSAAPAKPAAKKPVPAAKPAPYKKAAPAKPAAKKAPAKPAKPARRR